MGHKALITGGTGLIGRRLTELLLQAGYDVALLSRRSVEVPGAKVYQWDVEKDFVETGALENADYIIHLAGAGVADQRWTEDRKKVIMDSRTKGLALIAKKLQMTGIRPKALISAAGSSYYGMDTGNRHHIEDSPVGGDFLADVSLKWEKSADLVASLGIRTVKLRTGAVLTPNGGALEKMVMPARFGFGAPLGSGNQWVSWIHIDDICRMYIAAMENDNWQGAYNAVTGTPVTNKELTRQICKTLHRPRWLPNVPQFALRAVFGEMANLILGSSYVVNWRIVKETDFAYKFPELGTALRDLLDG